MVVNHPQTPLPVAWHRRHAWRLHLGCVAVMIAGYFALPPATTTPAAVARVVGYMSVGILALVAMIAGIRWHRPAVPRAWWLLVASHSIYVVADLTFYVRHYLLHLDAFPSYPDVLYIAHLPIVVVALLLLVRRRHPGGDQASLAEAGVVIVSAGLLSWLFLLQPNVSAPGATLPVRFVSVVFPVMDLAIAAICIRLFTARERLVASDLLLAAFGLIVVADSIYGLMQLAGTYTTGNFIDGIWLASYACIGAAALHPSMRDVGARAVAPRPMTMRRMLVLTPWAFLPPGLLLVESLRGVADLHAAEIAVASIAVAALVTWRTVQLVGTQTRALRLASDRGDALEVALRELGELQDQKAALLERTMQVGEIERTRVAVELHDGPIQRLASIAYVIDANTARAEQDPAATRECLDGLRDQIGSEVEGLRRIMAELRPPVLDHGGLIAALDDYLDEFGTTHSIATTLVDRLDGARIRSKAEIAMYRVVQEALANVAKHAAARSVEIVVEARDGELELVIHDDGVGFDENALTRVRDHFGLDAIRERLANVGGTVEFRASPGRGTTVIARAPLPIMNVA